MFKLLKCNARVVSVDRNLDRNLDRNTVIIRAETICVIQQANSNRKRFACLRSAAAGREICCTSRKQQSCLHAVRGPAKHFSQLITYILVTHLTAALIDSRCELSACQACHDGLSTSPTRRRAAPQTRMKPSSCVHTLSLRHRQPSARLSVRSQVQAHKKSSSCPYRSNRASLSAT